MQDIPTSSPRANHSDLHDTVNESINWEGVRESYTRLWDRSIDRALTSPSLMLGEGCTAAYMPWFLAVTRRYIVNPVFWRTAEAFQGTQGATQALVNSLVTVLLTSFHYSSSDYVFTWLLTGGSASRYEECH